MNNLFRNRNFVILTIAIIMIAAFAIRSYHFSDWLYFQGDQARDAYLVGGAYENGIGDLPLLGPRAGGTFTRLGPIFYYFQYIAVRIFGNSSPAVFAFPDLLFSILTIPLLYLFLRKFFKASWSILLTLLYSVSLYAVQYSRFAWNPNSLPFFNLLFFYAFLNVFHAEENKKKIIWSAVAGLAYAVASQLHFLSLGGIPIIAALFIVLRFKYIRSLKNFKWWKYILVALLVVVVFYIPFIFSEILTHGNNSLSIMASSASKTSSGSFGSSVIKNFSRFSEYFLVIWTGIVDSQGWLRNISAIFIIAGVISNIALLKKEKDEKKINFLLIILLWLTGYFLIYAFVKAKISARFFLPILPIPFILLGFIVASFLNRFRAQFFYWLWAVFIIFLVAANAYSVSIWFKEIKNSELGVFNRRNSDLNKAVSADIWWHLEKTTNFMKNDCTKDKILIFTPQKKYSSLFEYAMQYAGEERNFLVNWETAEVDSQACYYAVRFTKDIPKGFNGGNFSEEKITPFGYLSLVKLELASAAAKDGQIVNNPYRNKKKNADVSSSDEDSASGADDNQSTDVSDENLDLSASSDASNESSSTLIVPRMDRMFWRDVVGYFKK
jgi:4-amino-4-deoxy-L-arabinose transferase-like glycosyltransferase